jgi:DnaJ-domain-containing protein 1
MLDRIFDRLSSILASYLGGGKSHSTETSDDPYLEEAWQELNDYLRGKESATEDRRGYGRGKRGEDRRRDDESKESREGHQEDRSELHKDYNNLEVAYGAPFEEVRRAYRRLLRLYHPDRFAGDPEKLEVATEVVKRINASYQRIRAWEAKRRIL